VTQRYSSSIDAKLRTAYMKVWIGAMLILTYVATSVVAFARPLPLPPPPAPRTAGVPAPVPNRDAVAPPAPLAPTGPTIHPRLLQTPTYQNSFDPSTGYVAGSQMREDQEDLRHPLIPSPGFVVSIPLH
jgi:hypothetical protein